MAKHQQKTELVDSNSQSGVKKEVEAAAHNVNILINIYSKVILFILLSLV